MQKSTKAAILLLLHQPFRVTDITKYDVSDPDKLFEGAYKKAGMESSNQKIFEQIALNTYIPTSEYLLNYLQNHPDFHINFSFSGTFLQQCQKYSKYGSQIIMNFQDLINTGRVGIAGDTSYHSIAHLYSLQEFAYQVNAHRNKIYDIFGVWPTFYRNTENQINNDIAEFVRLMGYDSIAAPGVYQHLLPGEVQEIKSIQRPNLSPQVLKWAIENNPKQHTARFISVAPIDHPLSDIIFFLKHFESSRNQIKELIDNSGHGFHLLFNDFEALGEHNKPDEVDVRSTLGQFLDLCTEQGLEFVSIDDVDDYSSDTTNRYDIPNFVSSGNSQHNLESWRGTFHQEKAFILLTELHKLATQLYDDDSTQANELLNHYRYLTTSDHFYYLADIPGPNGEIHEMFSPYNSRQEAFEAISFAIDFVTQEIQEYLEQ